MTPEKTTLKTGEALAAKPQDQAGLLSEEELDGLAAGLNDPTAAVTFPRWICFVCGGSFGSEDDLRAHRRIVHGAE